MVTTLMNATIRHGELLVRNGVDAHQRLAIQLARLAGDGPEDSDVRRVLARKSTWTQRFAAVSSILARPSVRVRVVDIDAAWVPPSIQPSYDDANCLAERTEMFALLAKTAITQRWELVRPTPKAEVTDALLELGHSSAVCDLEAEPRVPTTIPVGLAGVWDWLVASGRVNHAALRGVLEEASAEDAPAYLLETFYDCAGPRLRQALSEVSLLRERHPLARTPQESRTSVFHRVLSGGDTQRRLDELEKSGVLVRGGNGARQVYLSRTIRDWVLRRLGLVDREELLAMRTNLAQQLAVHRQVDARLESHRLSVLAGDVETAVRTAAYFGTDLRLLARRISTEGGRKKDTSRFRIAADIYRRIVSDFDSDDAYSWQYLGFNLQRSEPLQAHAEGRTSTDEIRLAFETSCKKSRAGFNPLYSARRVGFEYLIGAASFSDVLEVVNRANSQGSGDALRFVVPPLRDILEIRGVWDYFVTKFPDALRVPRRVEGADEEDLET